MDTNTDEPRFSMGQMVQLSARPEISGAVVAVAGEPGAWTYRVFTATDGIIECLEDQLAGAEVPDRSGRRVGFAHMAATLSAHEVLRPSRDVLHSVGAGRIDFIPYQYRPVLKIIKADRPRLLVADEVGVGKTIEAGLILKELRARDAIRSVAVVCPKPLVVERKWETEMRRFGEHFQTLDGAGLAHLIREVDTYGQLPPGSEQVIIPISLLQSEELLAGRRNGPRRRGRPGLRNLDPPLSFDLVIIDEAHRARNQEALTHEAVKLLCDNARAVVLLTATPLQMGQSDLYTLLRLIRPDLVNSPLAFEQMAAPNSFITAAAEQVRAGEPGWPGKARQSLGHALATSWGSRVLAQNQSMQETLTALTGDVEADDESRVALTRQVEDLHTFSHLINRTRRRDIGEFTVRRPETVRVSFTDGQRAFHDAVVEFVAKVHISRGSGTNLPFLLSGIRRQAASCAPGLALRLRDMVAAAGRMDADSDEAPEDGDLPNSGYWDMREFGAEIRALAAGGASLVDGPDPKIDALRDAIRRAEGTEGKVLVFATFRHTIAYTQGRLVDAGIRTGVITGTVPDHERVILRERFSRPRADPEALDVLLCSEVGSEGLDFQFCSTIANYDLPWNPMRIEQRIGRVDRYGQKAPFVSIWNLITRDTLDDDIYTRCLMRIGIFERTIGATEGILGKLTQGLEHVSWEPGLTPAERAARVQQLADNAIRESQELAALTTEEASLFGLRVGRSADEDVDDAVSAWLGPQALRNLVNAYLRTAGHPDVEPLARLTSRVALPAEVKSRLIEDAGRGQPREAAERWAAVLRRSGRSIEVSLEPDEAENRPGVELLHPAHPLVKSSAAAHDGDANLRVTLTTIDTSLPPGRYPFGVWRWRRLGLRDDRETVWICASADPRALTTAVSRAADDADASPLTATEVQQLEALHRERWEAGRAQLKTAVAETVDARLRAARTQTSAEIARLDALLATVAEARIRTMHLGQIKAARARLQDTEAQLAASRDRADVIADPLVLGVLEVRGAAEVSGRRDDPGLP